MRIIGRQREGRPNGIGRALSRFLGWCREHPGSVAVALGLVVAACGLALLAWGLEREVAVVAVLGVGVTASALLLVRHGLTVGVGDRPSRHVLTGWVLTTVGIIIALGFQLHWALGVVPIVSGLVLFTVGTRPLHRHFTGGSPGPAAEAWQLASIGSILLGVAFLLAGTEHASLIGTVLGIYLMVFGLIPLSAGSLLLGDRPVPSLWLVTAGVVIVITGLLFMPQSRPDWLIWVVGGIFAVLGISFVFRRVGVAIVVLGLSVGLWLVLADRTDDSPLDPNPGASERILAVGDSYISGEGSSTFFKGTNVVGAHQNQCRRSSTAYPYLVASRLGMGLDFFACSGATTSQIYEVGQMDERSPVGIPGARPQLDNLPPNTSDIRVVLVSIGGNDALFGDIGLACVLPGSCNAFRENWLAQVAKIGPDITAAYEAIKQKVGSDTPVVAVPYPRLLTEEGCGWSTMEASEHDFLVEFLTILDDRVRRSAEEAGIYFFEKGLYAFDGAQICEGGPDGTLMNFFNVLPPEGDLGQANPTNWVHGTFHPKTSGHRAIADMLAPWLDQLLTDIDAGVLKPNPDPNLNATFEVRRQAGKPILGDPDSLTALPGLQAACPGDRVSPFATLLPLLDESDSLKLNASPTSPICYTLPDGTWTDDEENVVTRSDGPDMIHPILPEDGFRQRFVYQDASDGSWQLRVVEFCSLKPRCPYDVNSWIVDQLMTTARRTVLPGMLVFFGAWMLTYGLRVRYGAMVWNTARRTGRTVRNAISRSGSGDRAS
jgi:lysophospholipase L1-like esterase